MWKICSRMCFFTSEFCLNFPSDDFTNHSHLNQNFPDFSRLSSISTHRIYHHHRQWQKQQQQQNTTKSNKIHNKINKKKHHGYQLWSFPFWSCVTTQCDPYHENSVIDKNQHMRHTHHPPVSISFILTFLSNSSSDAQKQVQQQVHRMRKNMKREKTIKAISADPTSHPSPLQR